MATFEQERDAVLKEMRAFSGKSENGFIWFITIDKRKKLERLLVDFVYSGVKPLISFPTEQSAYDCISAVGAQRIKDYYFSFAKGNKSHGRWIDGHGAHGEVFFCSECGKEPWWCAVQEEILPPFCPNCGAEMALEVDE